MTKKLMLYDEDLTTGEKQLIILLNGKNRMEIDEILGEVENDTLRIDR